MISEAVTLWQQIIIRATIVVGLTAGLLLTVLAAIVWAVVYFLTRRRRASDKAEEHSDVNEYDEAA